MIKPTEQLLWYFNFKLLPFSWWILFASGWPTLISLMDWVEEMIPVSTELCSKMAWNYIFLCPSVCQFKATFTQDRTRTVPDQIGFCLHRTILESVRNGSKRFQNWTYRNVGPVLDPFWTGFKTVPCKQKANPVRLSDRIHLEPLLYKHSLSWQITCRWTDFLDCVCTIFVQRKKWLRSACLR